MAGDGDEARVSPIESVVGNDSSSRTRQRLYMVVVERQTQNRARAMDSLRAAESQSDGDSV